MSQEWGPEETEAEGEMNFTNCLFVEVISIAKKKKNRVIQYFFYIM